METWLEPMAKAATYVAVLLLIGTCATRWLLVPRIDVLPPQVHEVCQRWLQRALLVSSAAVLATLFARAATHSITIFGLSEAFSLNSLRAVAVTSRWGQGWRMQVIASLLVLVAPLGLNMHRPAGWIGAAASTVALVATMPLMGHAAGHVLRAWLHGVHILGAGVWVGTLAVVATAPSASGAVLRPRLLSAFAPVAALGAAALLVSGAVASWIYLSAVTDLWRTEYGRLLGLKLALVAGVAFCGYLSWRRFHRPTPDRSASWTVATEICLALAVVLVTAWLTERSHPG